MMRVERAAILLTTGEIVSVPPPGRHGDCIRVAAEARCWDTPDNTWHSRLIQEQGFVLSDGTFVMRKAAWRIAKEAGQLLPRAPTDGHGGRLYSEDVW
jgi:hypothetical protein